MPLIRLDLEIGLINLLYPAATIPLTAAILTTILGSLLVLRTICLTMSIKIDSLSLLVSI